MTFYSSRIIFAYICTFLHTFVHVYVITSYTVIIQIAYNSICESNLLTDDIIKYREESSNCYILSSPNKLPLYLLYPQYLRLYNLRWLYGLIQLELELCLPCKPKHLAKAVFKSWTMVVLNQPSIRVMSFGKLLKSNVRTFISYGFLGTAFVQVLNEYTIQVFGFVQMSILNIEKYFYLD